jgi:phage regulator Rha-like protein
VNELIVIRSNEAFTNSMVVANGTGNTHHAVQQMIKKYEPTLERWGKIEFTHLKCRNSKQKELLPSALKPLVPES